MHTSICLIGIEARFVHFVRLLLDHWSSARYEYLTCVVIIQTPHITVVQVKPERKKNPKPYTRGPTLIRVAPSGRRGLEKFSPATLKRKRKKTGMFVEGVCEEE